MPEYLIDNPPKTRQFRRPRREKPSGVIVIHTAESILDQIGEDSGAEDVARFIANRWDYGSYHTLADSDSTVRLIPFDAEAYGDRTGSNYHAIHISFACKAAGWVGMSAERRAAMIHQGAKAAAEAAIWLAVNHRVVVPAFRISREDSERRLPGFISHAQRDPERRSDPGADFPWEAFFAEFVAILHPGPSPRDLMRTDLTAAIRATKAAGVRAVDQGRTRVAKATVRAVDRLRAARKRVPKD